MQEGFLRFSTIEGPANPVLDDLNDTVADLREEPPSWLKTFVQDTIKTILEPKNFESPELYEKLGVRIYKKYVPTTGDLITRLVWKKIRINNGPESLDDLLATTKFTEILHHALFAGMLLPMAGDLARGQLKSAAVTGLLNVLINAYPIILQRYNRMRLVAYKQRVGSQ